MWNRSQHKFSAGGSAQNSMRILQWLCDETLQNRYTIYCGGIGNDSGGKMLEILVKSAGVDVRFADSLNTIFSFISFMLCF